MKKYTTSLIAAAASMLLLPAVFCQTPAPAAKPGDVPASVKGLTITIHKSDRPGIIVVRLENHAKTSITLLPDSILQPCITIMHPGPDKNTEDAVSVTREYSAGGEDIDLMKAGKTTRILEPGQSFEVPLKMADLLARFDPKERAAWGHAKGTKGLYLNFQYLVVGVGADKHPVDAFNADFAAQGYDFTN